jgi:hypothetical protein
LSFLNGLAGMFKDSALSALGAGFEALADPQSFLKDDLPANANPVAKWIQSRNRRACRLHARNEAAGSYSDLGALRRPRYERVCGPYLDSIGEGQTSGGGYAPPFTGGQCSNVTYAGYANFRVQTGVVNGVRQYAYNPTKQQATPNTLGPITVGPSQTTTGSQPPLSSACYPKPSIVYSQSVSAPGLGVGYVWRTRTENLTFNDAPACQSAPWSAINLEFRRVSGAADSCGNPPNQYTPPQYPPNLPPIGPPDTSTPPPGGDGGDDVTIDPDGNIRICENGDCSDPFPPGGGGGDPSEDPGEEDGDPNENDPNNPSGDITGCASEGQILTGIKIEITRIPVGENPGSGGFYRNVCWVWMGPSQDQLDLVTDGRFLESGQFVIPDSNNCRCYRVRPSPLWGLSVQAYSRPEKED